MAMRRAPVPLNLGVGLASPLARPEDAVQTAALTPQVLGPPETGDEGAPDEGVEAALAIAVGTPCLPRLEDDGVPRLRVRGEVAVPAERADTGLLCPREGVVAPRCREGETVMSRLVRLAEAMADADTVQRPSARPPLVVGVRTLVLFRPASGVPETGTGAEPREAVEPSLSTREAHSRPDGLVRARLRRPETPP